MILFIKFILKDIRKLKGISQKKLASLTGFSQSYISQLELDKKSPTIEVINIIAHALKVNPFELMVLKHKSHLLIFFILFLRYNVEKWI